MFNKLLGNAELSNAKEMQSELADYLLDGEQVDLAFKLIRDFFVFTNWRLVMVDKQGITGKKVEYLSIPYKSITAFSVESAGRFDLDGEIKVWLSGMSEPVIKTVNKKVPVEPIQKALAIGVKSSHK